MKVRPEQWVLLGILAVGLALLILQLGQQWSFPEIGPAASPPDERGSDGAAGSAPWGQAPPAAAGSTDGAPGAAAPLPEGGPLPESPPPAPGGPALGLRLEPAIAAVGQPLVVFVTVERAAGADEVSFELLYDAALLEPDLNAQAALEVLGGGGQPPESEVRIAEPGRLTVRLRKHPQAPAAGGSGDLFVIQFAPTRPGAGRLRVQGGAVQDASGARSGARGSEAAIEVR